MTSFQRTFANYLVSESLDEALGDVVEALAEGSLDRASFDALAKRHGVQSSARFREGLLDMILHVVRQEVRDHALVEEDFVQLRALGMVFRIREGDFYRHRRAEVAALLGGEIHRL